MTEGLATTATAEETTQTTTSLQPTDYDRFNQPVGSSGILKELLPPEIRAVESCEEPEVKRHPPLRKSKSNLSHIGSHLPFLIPTSGADGLLCPTSLAMAAVAKMEEEDGEGCEQEKGVFHLSTHSEPESSHHR